MRHHRLLALASFTLALGLSGLAAPKTAHATAPLCGPNYYVVCPDRTQLEEDCQAESFGCHTSNNCSVNVGGGTTDPYASDCNG